MNPLIDNLITTLNTLGGGFCDYTGSMFVQSGVLIVSLLFVDFLIRKRVRATLRYWIWMLVFVKLILPPSLSLPTGLGYWRGEFLSAKLPNLEQGATIIQQKPVESPVFENTPLPDETSQIQSSQTYIEPTGLSTAVVSHLNALNWQASVFVLWVVGVLVITALLIQRIFFVKELIVQSQPAKNRLVEMLDQCRQQIKVRRTIELRLSNNVPSPAVCGFFKPVILIPAALIEKLSPSRLRAILIHELCHIKRGDLWINSAQTILQIIYFYNPLVWLVNVVVRRIREQAVDEMVLVTLGARAKDYSNILIDIAEMAFLKTSLSLRLIGVVESKKALHRRIKLILNRPVPKKAKIGFLGVLIVIIIGAILIPMAKGSWSQRDRINKLVEKLSSQDDAVWEPAAEQLKKIGPKVAGQVAELFRAASDDLHAIRVLESMATDERVQDVMVQGLSDKNSNVRHCSLIILSKSGNRDHVKRIIPLLRKDVENGEDYSMAEIALAELGGDDAYNALVETITKSIPDQLRWMIADHLAAMGRPEAVPNLKDALKLVDPSHPSAGARIVEAIHRLEDKNEIVEKPYPNSEHTFTLHEFDSGYSQRGILYAYDLQKADDTSVYVGKPPAGTNAEETTSANLRALVGSSRGDLIFERVGEKTRLQAYHGTLLAPLEGKFEPPRYFWTDAIVKMNQSELKQLVLDYNNRHAKEIAGSIPGFRLYPFDEGDMFAAVLPSGQIAILATEKIVSYTSGVRLSVLYLDPLLTLVGIGRIEASQDSTADADKSQFIATLPNGVRVEESKASPIGNYALRFDGINDFLEIHASESLKLGRSFTIQTWIKPEFPDTSTPDNGRNLLSKGGYINEHPDEKGNRMAHAYGFGLNLRPVEGPRIALDMSTGNGGIYTSPIFFRYESGWLHLVIVSRKEGGGASQGIYYIQTGDVPYQPAPNSNIIVGGDFLIPMGNPFKGQIAELRIWSRALDSVEVEHYKTVALTGDEPNLVGCWTFEQGQGQRVQDLSRFKNDASLGSSYAVEDSDPVWVRIGSDKENEKLPIAQAEVEKKDAQVKEESSKRKTVMLPDVDSKNLMLDLASGELLDIPKADAEEEIWSAIEKLGKGDVVYDASSLILVRGATTQSPTEAITGPFKACKIEQKLPVSLTITTKEGIDYAIKVQSADNKECRLEYYSLSHLKRNSEDLAQQLAVLEHERDCLAERIKQYRQTIRELGDEFGDIDLKRRQQMMLNRVAALMETLTETEAERIKLETEIQILERTKEQPMDQDKLFELRQAYINGDPTIKAYAEDIIQLEREIIIARQTMAETHPEIQRKTNLLESMKERLAKLKQQANIAFDEISKKEETLAGEKLLASKRNELEQKEAFEKRLRETLSKQNSQAIELGRKQLTINDFTTELERARKNYDLILNTIMEIKSKTPNATQLTNPQNK